ncbi:MAG: COX15/CtaA family protein [Tepidisphaeraceae bacterium]|jgi:cytochrome c oxidase assembly protein subunit 15
MPSETYNRGLHRIAMLAAAATFPLIFLGGLVTSHQAGLAVPDWPNSFGYNMFLFPPRYWDGGIFFEHTHRLWASVVGMICIVLCAWAWWTDSRRLIRGLATAVLAMVIVQGILGGLRVIFKNLDLAMVHACVAQAFFCLAALMAVVTSRWWTTAPDLTKSEDAGHGRRLVIAAGATVAVVYCQLIVGAVMRHEKAGLAVPDIPLIYGRLVPPTTASELASINSLRVWKLDLPAVTLGQIWLHYAHRVGALVVSFFILGLVAHILLFHRRRRGLVSLALLLLGLLITQLVLGLATVYYKKPADVASAHVAVGALVLMVSFVITVAARRLYWPRAKQQLRELSDGLQASRTQASILSPQP